jgi:hypothetical protein
MESLPRSCSDRGETARSPPTTDAGSGPQARLTSALGVSVYPAGTKIWRRHCRTAASYGSTSVRIMTGHRPIFCVVLRDGDRWQVEPDGSIESIDTFKAYFDAHHWVSTQSAAWLQQRI